MLNVMIGWGETGHLIGGTKCARTDEVRIDENNLALRGVCSLCAGWLARIANRLGHVNALHMYITPVMHIDRQTNIRRRYNGPHRRIKHVD